MERKSTVWFLNHAPRLCVRVVKGDGLKCRCASFVGANPTAINQHYLSVRFRSINLVVESSSYERPTPVRFWYGAFGGGYNSRSNLDIDWLTIYIRLIWEWTSNSIYSLSAFGAACGAYRSHDVIAAYLFLTQEILVQVQMRPFIYRVLMD